MAFTPEDRQRSEQMHYLTVIWLRSIIVKWNTLEVAGTDKLDRHKK